MSTSREPQFMLMWKGRQIGPFSLAAIREKLGSGEISRMHQVSFNGQWMVLDEFLAKHAGGDAEAQRREEARKREEQLKREFEHQLATERAHKADLEERLADAERRSSLSHLLPPQHQPQAPPPAPLPRPVEEPQLSFPRHSVTGGPDAHLHPQSDSSSLKQILGLIGSALLILGVFCPIVSVPVMGSLNYFQNGKGDGTIVLVLAAATVVLAIVKRFPLLWFTGGGSLGLLVFTFVNFQKRMSEAKREVASDLRDNPFAGLADMALQSVQLQWGVAILAIGALLVIAAAAIPLNPQKQLQS